MTIQQALDRRIPAIRKAGWIHGNYVRFDHFGKNHGPWAHIGFGNPFGEHGDEADIIIYELTGNDTDDDWEEISPMPPAEKGT